MNNNMKSNFNHKKILKITIAAVLLLMFIVSPGSVFGGDPDAIAVRIMSNKNHYNVIDWYYSKGFSGAPQSIMVDGYQAIRDGRTVYVGIGNVNDSDELWHNIALISYTNNAQPTTKAIFAGMLKNWKFNTNATDDGTCGMSAIICVNDNDCAPDYECRDLIDREDIKRCVSKEAISCRLDEDCPAGLFCNSMDAKIRRDIRRVGDIAHLQNLLPAESSEWPALNSGTYAVGKTMSVWPSWQQTLGAELGETLPVDPINAITCFIPGSATCWDDVDKKFSYPDFISGGGMSPTQGFVDPGSIARSHLSGYIYYYDKDNTQGFDMPNSTAIGRETEYSIMSSSAE